MGSTPSQLSSGATFEAGAGAGGGFEIEDRDGVKTNRVAVVHGVVVT